MQNALRTYLAGLVGRGIGGSRSPEMHEREAAALGMPLVYRRIDFDQLGYEEGRLEDTLRALQAIGFDGMNVTHPFKQRVLAALNQVSPDAAALGAVNTVVFRDGARHGFNTDWTGFRASFKRELPDAALNEVAQIGSGGAGSATAYALLSMGARRIRIFDTDPAKARAMIERIGRHFPDRSLIIADNARAALEGADGVVQTSPIGMASHPGTPFDLRYLRSAMWVSEVIYFPAETELLRAARLLGCACSGGGAMAVYQAADAFQLITGIEPSVTRMLANFGATK